MSPSLTIAQGTEHTACVIYGLDRAVASWVLRSPLANSLMSSPEICKEMFPLMSPAPSSEIQLVGTVRTWALPLRKSHGFRCVRGNRLLGFGPTLSSDLSLRTPAAPLGLCDARTPPPCRGPLCCRQADLNCRFEGTLRLPCLGTCLPKIAAFSKSGTCLCQKRGGGTEELAWELT